MKTLRLWIGLILVWMASSVWAAGPNVGTYVLQTSKRVSATDWELVYAATLTNPGEALRSVTATLASSDPATVVVEGTLSFGDVAAKASVASLDTFTIRQNRSKPFNPATLVWTVSGTPAVPLRASFNVSAQSGDAPLSVVFSPNPITNAAINSFQWDFNGDGVFDISETVGRNQAYKYTVPGTYKASLTVTDSQGRKDTQTQNIVVTNAPPVVSASANPTNGQVPLTVAFTATATDSDGIASYEWDYQGNGSYSAPSTSTAGSFTYATAGTYNPKVRVTDRLGASTVAAVPSMTVRAAPLGAPSVRLTPSPASGSTPLTVSFSAVVTDPGAKPISSYEWDFDGDGTFDATTTTASKQNVYNTPGTYYPQVRITTQDGRTALDVKTVVVTSQFSLSLTSDTVDTTSGQTIGVRTTLGGAVPVSIVIEKRGGGVVRTLLPRTSRNAGAYTDTWDGKDDSGAFVPEGVYLAVLLYETGGVTKRLDLSTTTGGLESNPTRSAIPATFSPFDGQPLTINFTLTRAAEVTAFMGSFNVNTRYVTFYTRQPFGRGTYQITWNGDNTEGQLIQPAPGDSFLFGIFQYTLPDNGIFVRGGVALSGLKAAPSIFDPTGFTDAGQRNLGTVSFQLTQAATVELTVQDTLSGAVIRRLQVPGLSAGQNTITWDGKAGDGRYAAPGTYRIGAVAIQSNGFKSLVSYTLQRVYY